MTIDSTYFLEERGPKEDAKYYYEFETASDSVVDVYIILPTGERIKALNLSEVV